MARCSNWETNEPWLRRFFAEGRWSWPILICCLNPSPATKCLIGLFASASRFSLCDRQGSGWRTNIISWTCCGCMGEIVKDCEVAYPLLLA